MAVYYMMIIIMIIYVLYDSVDQLQELLSSLVWRSSPKKQKNHNQSWIIIVINDLKQYIL